MQPLSGWGPLQRATVLARWTPSPRTPLVLYKGRYLKRVLVLPRSNDDPSVVPQDFGLPFVALPVLCDFFRPPFGVRLGCNGMERTAVPKSAIYEDRDPGPAQDDVRPSGQRFNVDPISHSPAVESAPQSNLRSRSCGAKAGHELSDDLGRGGRSCTSGNSVALGTHQ
jgi:hypothetical protein